MKEKGAPLLIFADLAFFLFSVLVLSYQYATFADRTEQGHVVGELLVDLPFLKNANNQAAEQLSDEVPQIVLTIPPAEEYYLDDRVVLGSDIESTLKGLSFCDVHIQVASNAPSQRLVTVLQALEHAACRHIVIDYAMPERLK